MRTHPGVLSNLLGSRQSPSKRDLSDKNTKGEPSLKAHQPPGLMSHVCHRLSGRVIEPRYLCLIVDAKKVLLLSYYYYSYISCPLINTICTNPSSSLIHKYDNNHPRRSRRLNPNSFPRSPWMLYFEFNQRVSSRSRMQHKSRLVCQSKGKT